MKGLLYKDFLIVKKNSKIFLALLLFLSILLPVISLSQTGGADSSPMSNEFSGYLPVLSAIITLLMAAVGINCMAYDVQANWDPYARALPVERKTIVAAKYVTSLLCIAFGTVISTLLSILGGVLSGSFHGIFMITALAASVLYSIVYVSIMLPIQLKFGIEKSRIVMILFMAILYSLFFVFKELVPQGVSFHSVPIVLMIITAILLAAVLCATSYFVSLRIYVKKES